jgi:PKD repeat protein
LVTDICLFGSDSDYDANSPLRSATMTVGTKRYLLWGQPNDIDVYDITTPLQSGYTTINSAGMLNVGRGDDPDTHWYQTDHVHHMAVLDGFNYAVLSLLNYGWDILQVAPTPKLLNVGFKPTTQQLAGSAPEFYESALFSNGGNVYVVGAGLARGTGIAIYLLSGTDASGTMIPENFKASTIQPLVTIPLPTPWTGTPGNSQLSGYHVIDNTAGGGKRYLLVRSGSGQAAVVDITTPDNITSVRLLATWTTSTPDAALFSGEWAIDRNNKVLYVADSSAQVIHAYDIGSLWTTQPGTPQKIGDTRWSNSSDTGTPTSAATAGQVLVVGYYSKMAVINIANPQQPKPLDLESGINDISRNCSKAFGSKLSMLRAFQNPPSMGGGTYMIRSMIGSGDIVQILDSCLDTTPRPSITVARNPNQGTLDPICSATADPKGYPGDTFTITNTSAGVWANPVLTVTPPGGAAQPVGGGPTTWTWTAPANATGTFTFNLTIYDQASPPNPYSGTQTVFLCSGPKASAQVTACSSGQCPPLQNESVTISAAPTISQGHPSSYNWVVTAPDSTTQPNTGATINVTLATRGTYTVAMVAHYGFPGADDTTCSAGAFTGLLTSSYDSCASLTVNSQPFSVNPITVSQGSTPQPFLLGQAIGVAAPYRVATGWTATFQWQLDGAPGTPVATWAGQANVTGTIAAGTLTAGSHTILFSQASATNGSDSVNLLAAPNVPPPPQTFQVTDCVVPGQASGPLPTSGSTGVPPGNVVLRWTGSGTTPRWYDVVEQSVLGTQNLCTQTANTFCQVPLSAGQILSWRVITYNACSPALGVPGPVWTVKASNPTPPPTPTPTPTPTGLTANFTYNPTNPQAGQTIQFTDTSSGGTATDWSWTFGDNPGGIFGGGSTSTLRNPTFAYANAGTFTVTLTVTFTTGQKSVSKSVTVSAPCTATGPPTASFTYASPARAGIPVQFIDTSIGSPTAWSWTFGDGGGILGGGGTSTDRNPSYTYQNAGTYTVTLVATNCKGSGTSQQQVQVVGSCDLTVPPTADFTWGPTGPLPDFPSQPQPFVGQPVTLTDNSTNSPNSWHWYDFQEDVVNATVTTPTFTHTWSQSGDKNVRMAATNCFGVSADVFKVVHIFDDVRPVVTDFTWSPTTNVTTNTQVTFTASQGMSYGSPTSFTWKFDDGSTQTGRSVTYSFKCGGDRTVTLTAGRGSYTGTANKTVSVAGQTCGPESVMAVDAAKVQGLNGTSWRTDVRILNPAGHTSAVHLQFLPVGKNNVTPFMAGPYPIGPKATLVLNNLLDWVFITLGQNFSKTALRVTYDNQDDLAPAVMARTYTPGPSGGNYGQFAPGIAVIPGTTPSTIWITGLHNDGFSSGFRTNYSLLNLRDDSGGSGTIRFTLFDATGAERGTATVGLAPFGYLQDSVSKLLGGNFDTIGDFSLKIDVPPGADIQAYGSVVDNLTGDPSLIPAVTPADSPIYLPAIAHLAGEAGTVWRSDLAVTNPDLSSAHTWELQYTPKQSGGPQVAKRTVTLAPGASLFVDDLVSWIYSGSLAGETLTSGIVRVGMGEGDSSGVYPVVAARSYNLTPNGTFGQNIMPMWAANGVSIDSNNKTMLIAGMSSEDIARTNLAFVSLSDTQGVNFSVLFYDESGNLLNPSDGQGNPTPFNFYVPPGSWDQDKLENRFLRAFKVSLPPNERAVSAVMTVVGGGPGLAYATVIDNQTGDPNFIPAQPTP